MNIHVGIMCHLEEELFRLLTRLRECGSVGTVQVLDDFSGNGYDTYVESLCREYGFRFAQRHLNLDFSAQRNHLMSLMPKGDFMAMLDADEMVPVCFFDHASTFIEANPESDSVSIARKNVTIGYDNSHRIVMERHVRIFRNVDYIHFGGRIHEGQRGLRNTIVLPPEDEIEHTKTEARCKKQHCFYNENFYRHGIT